jgi:hypothetical protein
MASFRNNLYMPSMQKMHKTAKAKKGRQTSSPSSKSSRSSSGMNSTTATTATILSTPRYSLNEVDRVYEGEEVLDAENRRTAHEARGLTIRDVMKITVPYRNSAGHHRMQSMSYKTGAGYRDARTKETPITKKQQYFADSYIPPGMSPPKHTHPSQRATPKSPSLSELKQMGIAKQRHDSEEREALKRGELRRKDANKLQKTMGNNNSTRRRRSFNEGSNSRRRGGSRNSRLHSSRPGSSPATKRTGAANDYDDDNQHVPQTTRYVYPNERRMADLDDVRQAPQVPPSRRKLAEVQEERHFRNGGMSKRRLQDQEEAESAAQLKVEQILAEAARGRAANGSWGKTKPPKRLWPSSAQKNHHSGQ